MTPTTPGDHIVECLAAALASRLPYIKRRPFVIGLCGAQGSGKSTASLALAQNLGASGIGATVLALDDLYLPREERLALTDIHPLLGVRGVPGTHDPALGLSMINALGETGPVPMPRFDKALDTRRASAEWDVTTGPVDVVILEGWCVGALPQSDAALVQPINALERDEDPDWRWRTWVNARLATDYQPLFARIDLLALIAAPDFDVVAGWRRQQEQVLRTASKRTANLAMSDAEIDRFVLHYQRLTEHILKEMPSRADLVMRLDRERNVISRHP